MDCAIWDPFSGADFRATGTPSAVYARHMEQVRDAEQLGYDHYYLIEHQSHAGLRCTSTLTILAAMTQHTSVIRLGAMIFPLPFHNPVRLAQDAATIDQLSRGRLEFGTGIGTAEHEFHRFNIEYGHRQEMGEEALEIIQQAWTADAVTYDGKFWQFREHLPFPKPYQKPHPPIWAGCHSVRSHEFAARNSFGCAQNIDTDEDIAEHFAIYHKVWAETHAPDAPDRTFLMRQVYVAETDEEAHATARARFPNTWGLENSGLVHQQFGLDPGGYAGDKRPETLKREKIREMLAGEHGYEWGLENGIFLVGSPDMVAAAIERTAKRVGGLDVFCANFEFGRLPVLQARRSMELFGEHVLPAVHDIPVRFGA